MILHLVFEKRKCQLSLLLLLFHKYLYIKLTIYFIFVYFINNNNRVIDSLIPILLLIGSLSITIISYVHYIRKTVAVYAPLKTNQASSLGGYGATNNASLTTVPSITVDGEEQDEEDLQSTDSSSTSNSTISPSYEVRSSRWSIYNCTRLIAASIQVAIYLYSLTQLVTHNYSLDKSVEGSENTLTLAVLSNFVFWVS